MVTFLLSGMVPGGKYMLKELEFYMYGPISLNNALYAANTRERERENECI